MTLDDRTVLLDLERGLPAPDEVVLLDPWESIDDRRRGLLPTEGLGSKEVHLFGAGSLGSPIGLLLAQVGVGRFRVYDCDRLSVSNLARHTCGLTDLWREKSLAVTEQLSLRGSNAIGLTVDLSKIDDDQLDLLLKPADVVVAATDSPAVQFALNEAVVRAKKSAVFVGAWDQAAAGEILSVRSGQGPCLYCSVGFRVGVMPGLSLNERRVAYQSADENRLEAEPGLAVDITFLAAIAAAHVLALLDPHGSRGALLERSTFSLLHGPSAPRGVHADLFRAPLEHIAAGVTRESACPVCGFHHEEGVA